MYESPSLHSLITSGCNEALVVDVVFLLNLNLNSYVSNNNHSLDADISCLQRYRTGQKNIN